MCLSNFDDQERKPEHVCSVPHPLCRTCITSIKIYNTLKKRNASTCPVCKEVWSDEKLKTILHDIEKTITEIESALKMLPENMRKLFTFTTIYLPGLNKILKENNKL